MIKLITHNGSFHSDDVFACATLSLLLEKRGEKLEIIRSRDEKIIDSGDIVFDVGGIYDAEKNKFDHHQIGGAGKRENGIPYSSFGLIWKKFGEELCGKKSVADKIDKRLVQSIDAFDNGIGEIKPILDNVEPYLFQNITGAFLQISEEGEEVLYERFLKLVQFSKDLLEREILKAKDRIRIEKVVKSAYNLATDKRLIILDKYFTRVEVVEAMVDYKEILYAVVPSGQLEHWKLLASRKSPNSFILKKPFPKSWAGKIDKELVEATGIKDVIFCHNGLFMAVTKTKESAIKLAKLALEN